MDAPARSSRSHSNRGPAWSRSGATRVAFLAMAAFTPLRTMAQSVTARDDGDVIDHSGLVMTTMQNDRLFSVSLNQLPAPRPEQFTRKMNFAGNLVLYTADTQTSLQSTDWVFISCDNSNGTVAFERAIAQTRPYCVIFYTVEHDWCDFNPGDTYTNVFTTLDREQANDFQLLLNNTNSLNVGVEYDSAADDQKELDGQGSAANTSDNQNSVFGPTPSTSVALIILYSITGVITALFLLIIIIGAVRAHRHPERYGPRASTRFGRPRQSRAKGLARAVLDTLPIVRFGGEGTVGTKEEVVKPTDVEMNADSIRTPRVSSENGEEQRSTAPSMESGVTPEDVGATVAVTTTAARDEEELEMSTAEMDPSQLQCPVCMEDFESGQDLRVLPCHHSFHPDCIDPWLLNVAGSCPLCRIDLRPEDQRQSLEMPPAPPEPEPTTGSRLARYLDIARGTTGEERMAALRQLREEQRGSLGGQRPRSRAPELGISRLRRVFHRRVSGNRSSVTLAGESSSSAIPSVVGGVESSRSLSGVVEPVRGREGLATINSLDLRQRSTDDRRPGNQQQPQL